MKIEDAPKLSFRNKKKIESGTLCGCYFCLTNFEGHEITDWGDAGETALCPRCDMDSVLPSVTDIQVLLDACKHWFTAKAPADSSPKVSV